MRGKLRLEGKVNNKRIREKERGGKGGGLIGERNKDCRDEI